MRLILACMAIVAQSEQAGKTLPVPIYNHFFNDQNSFYLNLGAFDPALVGPATATMLDEVRRARDEWLRPQFL
jgi:hypothetical protein